MPEGELQLQEPPTLPEIAPSGGRGVIALLPSLLMACGMMLMVGRGGGAGTSAIFMAIMGGGMLVTLVAGLATGGSDRRFRVNGARRDYLRYVAQVRRQVRQLADQQRSALVWLHPAPSSLWSVAMTSRLWERRAADADFGELRVGTGVQRLAVRVLPPETKPVEDLEPVAAMALRRFLRTWTSLPGQPIAVYLRGFPHLRLLGDHELARAFLRALLAQLTTLHGPDEVLLGVVRDERFADQWDWVKWLPHANDRGASDASGSLRRCTRSLEDLEPLLGEEFRSRPRFDPQARPSHDEPFVVVVLDHGAVPAGARFLEQGYRNALLVNLADVRSAIPGALTLEVSETELHVVTADPLGQEARRHIAEPDLLPLRAVTSLARRLARNAPAEVDTDVANAAVPNVTPGLPQLLGIPDLAEFNPALTWDERSRADRLRVPIGVSASGQPIVLDLKESAEGGMGPHGMLIGATGSGKSELLRTLVLALAATHSSETLNFVLVDFKGGATFVGLGDLPHVSALITNLADETHLVDRMLDALRGEMTRRQELLRAAGGYASLRDYESARREGAPLEPLPTLCLVVDEFSELIATHADFIELFVMVGRLGRSLGVHLLLASQRIEDGRIHQLESHLSYRIGLRTFSAMESRSVLGIPDAYELPSQPGHGYLRSDMSTITRFKAAYVSGQHVPTRRRRTITGRSVATGVLTFTSAPTAAAVAGSEPIAPSGTSAQEDAAPTNGSTVLEFLTGRLLDAGPPAHPVWLEPLAVSPTLDDLLPPLSVIPGRGLSSSNGPGGLIVPLGLVDKPFEQRRDLLQLDLTGAGGHVGLAGGPQTGKSTLVASLVCGLALTCTPTEVQVYCLDFGGGGLAPLARLPHVGCVTGRHDPERVQRTVSEAMTLLNRRERLFAAHELSGMPALRALRDDGQLETVGLGPEQAADVFFVVDGWTSFRQEFERAESTLRDIAGRGLSYGVHLVLTAARWSEVHHAMRDKLGTRLELRLGDTIESMIDLRAATAVLKAPGRGLTESKEHFLAALPRIDGRGDPTDAGEALTSMVDTIAACWDGPVAPSVRMLPAELSVSDLPAPDSSGGDLRVPIGLDEAELAPVLHEFRTAPYLTVLGDDESGKTNVLRLVARAIAQNYGPAEARVLAVDVRRNLYDDLPKELLLGYAVSTDAAREAAQEAAAGLSQRLPGPEVTPDQLARRDWWKGPLLYVLIDDYDLILGNDNPMSPLLPLLAQGADIGLHVVVTRPAAGVMRMSMDPFLRRMQELGAPDLVLSCPPSEGPVLGNVKPRQLPPGRALLCTRRGGRMVQTAIVPHSPALASVQAR